MSDRIRVDPTDPNGNNIAVAVQTREARIKQYQEQQEERRANEARIKEALAEHEAQAAERRKAEEKKKQESGYNQLVADVRAKFFDVNPQASEGDWFTSRESLVAEEMRERANGRRMSPIKQKLLASGRYEF